MTPEQSTALELRDKGHSRADIARIMGLSEHAVKRRLAAARKWLDADPAAKQAATVAGSQVIPHSFWLKTDTHSVYYKTPKDDSARDVLAEIAEAFKDVPAYTPTAPQETRGNLMTVYPLMDAHFGMRAWGRETGGVDYDLAHAERDLKQAFANLCADTPDSGHAVLILGGDTLHSDDNEGHTQSRSHVVDTDGRQYKCADVAIRAICHVVDMLAHKHWRLTVRVLRGNHDPHSHLVLHFALSQRYRNSPNITIEDAARDLFWVRHGRSLIAAHHGDRSPAQRLAMALADTCPDWSATRDRHILTGHIHHDSTKDFPGVKWWSLRAFCPTDEYGSTYGGRRALQSLTFDDKQGLKMHMIEGIYREG